GLALQIVPRLVAISGPLGGKAFFSQAPYQKVGDGVLVFNNQNANAHASCFLLQRASLTPHDRQCTPEGASAKRNAPGRSQRCISSAARTRAPYSLTIRPR